MILVRWCVPGSLLPSSQVAARLELVSGGWVSETAADGTVLLVQLAATDTKIHATHMAGAVAEHERRCLAEHSMRLAGFAPDRLKAHLMAHRRQLELPTMLAEHDCMCCAKWKLTNADSERLTTHLGMHLASLTE